MSTICCNSKSNRKRIYGTYEIIKLSVRSYSIQESTSVAAQFPRESLERGKRQKKGKKDEKKERKRNKGLEGSEKRGEEDGGGKKGSGSDDGGEKTTVAVAVVMALVAVAFL